MPSAQMSAKIKDYLGIAIIATLAVFAGVLISFAYIYYQAIKPSSFRSFSVSGEGKITTVPDVAEFNFSIITEGGKDLAALQEQNTKKVNDAIAFVKSKGVGEKDIKTQSYQVDPRYQYFNCPGPRGGEVVACPPPEIVGYAIHQNVQVKARDFTKVGELIGGVVQNGANSVSGLMFTIDDPFKVQNDARAEAIAKAKEKAEAIAAAGGFRLGRLLSIEEQGGVVPRPYPMYLKESAAGLGGADAAPSIEPGSEEVMVTVSLRYEIK